MQKLGKCSQFLVIPICHNRTLIYLVLQNVYFQHFDKLHTFVKRTDTIFACLHVKKQRRTKEYENCRERNTKELRKV